MGDYFNEDDWAFVTTNQKKQTENQQPASSSSAIDPNAIETSETGSKRQRLNAAPAQKPKLKNAKPASPVLSETDDNPESELYSTPDFAKLNTKLQSVK